MTSIRNKQLNIKQIAFAKVLLPTGEALYREVVVFNEANKAIDHFPLNEELPFVEWRNTTFHLEQ